MNKYDVEIVRESNGLYYAKVFKNKKRVEGVPEYVNYRTLKREIEYLTGFSILPMKHLRFKRVGRKQFARFNNYNRESEHLIN